MRRCHCFQLPWFLLAFLLATYSAEAQIASGAPLTIPHVIQFSGEIKNVNGSPRVGVVGVAFSLYGDSKSTVPLWQEVQNVTVNDQGSYTVLLGSTTANGLPVDLFSNNEAHWLGVRVEEQAEQPRTLLVAVPYALKAGDAQTLGGKPLSAFVLSDSALPAATSAPKASVANQPLIRGPLQLGSVGSGSTNAVAKFDSFGNVVGSALVSDLGTTLQVLGNITGILQGTTFGDLTNASVGNVALDFNISGVNNTAMGDGALYQTTASRNSAFGSLAMVKNTSGTDNTAVGYGALNQSTGNNNTAAGSSALSSNTTGNSNMAIGGFALANNTSGPANTAGGYNALNQNTTGTNNTAFGISALVNLTSGSTNTALGSNAGQNLTTGNNNIYVDNPGVATESNVIRIGTVGLQTDTFLTGVIHGNGSGLTNLPATQLSGGVAVVSYPQGGSAKFGLGNTPSNFQFDVENTDASGAGSNVFRILTPSANGATMRFVSTSANGRDFGFGSNFINGLGEFGIYDYTALASRFLIDASGRIGIGTSSPQFSFDLQNADATASGSNIFRLRTPSVNGAVMHFQSTAQHGHDYAFGSNFINGNGEFGVFDYTAGATRLFLDSAGNIGMGTGDAGIGTTGPLLFNLEIHNNDATGAGQRLFRVQTPSINGAVIRMVSTAANGRDWGVGTNFLNGQGELGIYDYTANNGIARLLINSSGNVGIGTNSPTAALDVNGVVRASNGIKFGDGSVLTTANGVGGGTITGVTAGSGLTGGGSSGSVSLAVDSTVARTTASNSFSVSQSISGDLNLSGASGGKVQLNAINGGTGAGPSLLLNGSPAGGGGGAGGAISITAGSASGPSAGGNIVLTPGSGTPNGVVTIVGNAGVTGTFSKGAGSFKIDDPLDPANKFLYHSFVESPDMKNVYDGVVVLDKRGEAWIQLPEYFEALNKDFRYQLTCIGSFAPVYIAQKISGNRFKIAGGRGGLEISWQVTGIRHDAYADAHRIPEVEDKPPAERGTYLHPELFLHSEPQRALSGLERPGAEREK
jgi:hypothetical protein